MNDIREEYKYELGIELKPVTIFTSPYVRTLTEYVLEAYELMNKACDHMEEQEGTIKKLKHRNRRLQEQVASAGNAYYQKDARTMSVKYAELNRRLGEHERKSLHDLGQKEAEIVTLKSELAAARAMLATKDIQIQTLEAQVEAYRKLPEPQPLSQQPKDNNGRFTCAEDGQTAKTKQQMAYDMHLQGYRKKEIADELGISEASVRVYIAKEKSINSESYNEEKEIEAAHAMAARYPNMAPAF